MNHRVMMEAEAAVVEEVHLMVTSLLVDYLEDWDENDHAMRVGQVEIDAASRTDLR